MIRAIKGDETMLSDLRRSADATVREGGATVVSDMSRTTAPASSGDDKDLLAKLTAAVKEANDAKARLDTANAAAEKEKVEYTSKSKPVGLLCLEVRKLHPTVKDFEAFLKKVQGLSLSWAYDCMRVAGGRITHEQLKEATKKRVKKHREAKKKLPTPAETPAAEVSVTAPDVTESSEASGERRNAENAKLDLSAEEKAAKQSAHYLAEFTFACRTYLPKITIEADRQKARLLVSELTAGKPQMKKAA